MNIAEFFNMGGYALYVWGSYGVTLVVLALNVLLARQQQRQVVRMLVRGVQRNRGQA